jgi:hypothetical protein
MLVAEDGRVEALDSREWAKIGTLSGCWRIGHWRRGGVEVGLGRGLDGLRERRERVEEVQGVQGSLVERDMDCCALRSSLRGYTLSREGNDARLWHVTHRQCHHADGWAARSKAYLLNKQISEASRYAPAGTRGVKRRGAESSMSRGLMKDII